MHTTSEKFMIRFINIFALGVCTTDMFVYEKNSILELLDFPIFLFYS